MIAGLLGLSVTLAVPRTGDSPPQRVAHFPWRTPNPHASDGSWRRMSSSRLRAEQQRLEDACESARLGGCISVDENDAIAALGGDKAATYGEITAKGTRLKPRPIASSPHHSNPHAPKSTQTQHKKKKHHEHSDATRLARARSYSTLYSTLLSTHHTPHTQHQHHKHSHETRVRSIGKASPTSRNARFSSEQKSTCLLGAQKHGSAKSRKARFHWEQKNTVLLLTHIEAALTHTRFRCPSACVCVCTGFGQLAVRLRLSDADRFADLGSGLGKCVLQAATDHHVADAVGIEFSQSRHEMARRSRDALPTAVASRVRFIEGDCASVGLWEGADTPLAGATVVWVCSTCFGAHLMERICGRLEAAASVRAVASLRPFVRLRGFAEAMPPEPCEMSWNAAAKLAAIGVGGGGAIQQLYDEEESGDAEHVYIYERIGPPPR